MIKKLGYFFHLVDDDNRMDLTEIAFMIILYKLVTAPVVDWAAMMTLAALCVNRMHNKYINNQPEPVLPDSIRAQADSLSSMEQTLSPIVDVIKEKL